MATISTARSICRSSPFQRLATKLISGVKSSRSVPRSANNALSRRIFRCPAELSVCVETMQPFHTATASALMTSMLSTSCPCHGWVSDDK
ncbi:hypothetical protein BVRB_9g225760 [Beta vulgaris subsp. vulgaris]|uniref:Protein NUCLEAR FUSION DEFECTIVE 6, chloroplastic/mitochondrial-like n=1 Tax=Beta vulgaris subsp. vulgaris TaxID=3555 RepID=A0A0J8B5T4_BETVV|nr:hypothetical protein BVRB_9g225760 [Beta vulgaris subsp. vulgaris]